MGELTDYSQLTDTEKKLLKTMLNPDMYFGTVQDIVDEAGTSRTTYYKAIKKTSFQRELKRLSNNLVIQDVAEITKALVREAKKGSAKHIQMALEMAGMYSKNINVNQRSVSVTLDGKDIKEMSDEMLIDVAKKYGVIDDDNE